MKNCIFLILFSALVVGCDSPQRTRAPAKWVTGNSLDNNSGGTGTGWNVINPDSPSGSGSGTVSSDTTGFSNCDLSDKYHTIDIGFFGICQSSLNEAHFKFKPSQTSTSIRTCIIPTYKETNGSSTYLGQPQCTYTTSNKEISGQLVKNRQGFQSYPINGVIVMKEPLIPAYFSCMNAYVNWPRSACPNGSSTSYQCSQWFSGCPNGAQTGPHCDAPARQFMGESCTNFKTTYSNAYVDIRLK